MTSTTEGSGGAGPAGGTATADAAVASFKIWPHRSMGRCGSLWVLGLVALLAMAVVLRSPPQAFWPLTWGSAVTVAALGLAFWCNHRAARWSETIEIGARTVRIARSGRRAPAPCAAEFNTPWVRLVVHEGRYVEHGLALTESGRSQSIGVCLSPAERLALAEQLAASLARARRIVPD
jgi:uncharacterized membrane protein